MEFLRERVEEYIGIDSVEKNVKSNWKCSIGVSCDLSCEGNEVSSKRYNGKVILLHNTDKFDLNENVNFLVEKVQHETSIIDGHRQLFFVHPRFTKKHVRNPRLECVVEIYNPRKEIVEHVTMKLNYKQFFRRKIIEKTGMWSYGMVQALENFFKLRSKGRNYAINATVKHFLVDPDELATYIGKYNTVVRDINNEWKKLIVRDWHENL